MKKPKAVIFRVVQQSSKEPNSKNLPNLHDFEIISNIANSKDCPLENVNKIDSDCKVWVVQLEIRK